MRSENAPETPATKFLRQHGILRADKQKITVMPHGAGQRSQIRPHNHGPVEPKLLQPRPALALTGGRTKTSQHRGHNLHNGHWLRILLALAKHCHHGSGLGWVWLLGLRSAGRLHVVNGASGGLTGAQNEPVDYMQIY